MRDRGVHIREGFPCFLTTAHTDDDGRKIVQAFRARAVEMQETGLLAARTELAAEHSLTSGTAPVAEAQREIFLAAMLGDDASCSFNESFNWHLRGPLNTDVLIKAINAIIDRHDALRATVDADGGNLKFAPALRLEIPLRDLTNMEASLRDA